MKRRLQCDCRVRSDEVLPTTQSARRRDRLAPIDPARKRLRQTIRGLIESFGNVGAVGHRLG
jgi:hypothetical protein